MMRILLVLLAVAACNDPGSAGPDGGPDSAPDADRFDSGPPQPPVISPITHSFGGVPIAFPSSPVTFTLSNPSSVPLTGVVPSLVGTGAADFMIDATSCTGTLLPSATCTIDVVAFAQSPGAKTANLTVTTSAGSVSANVDATALTGIRLYVTPGSHDFGTVGIGTTSPVTTFTVTNPVTPTGTLQVSTSGSDPTEFTVTATTCDGVSLATNESCTIDVRTAPLSAGAKSAVIHVAGSPGGSLSMTVSATAVNVDHQTLTPTVQDFGTVYVGVTSAAKTFTLTNVGATPLTGFTATIAGANPAEFSVGSSRVDLQACKLEYSIVSPK